jgi:AcrR family transcriptional regulator
MVVPRHVRDARRNRERILNAASELMSEHGFAGATIAAICKKADVMPPTLYWHFGDKEGLIVAVMERAASRWFEEFVPVEGVDPTGPPRETLNALFRERPEFLRLSLLLALERRDPDSQARAAVEHFRDRAKQSWSQALEGLLAEIKSPRKRRAAADQLSDFLLMQIDGAFIACQLHPERADVDTFWQLTQAAIRAAADELIRGTQRP